MDIVEILFKKKFWIAVIKSAIITIAFFVAVENFWRILWRDGLDYGLVILVLITFYFLFYVIAFKT